MSKIIESLSDNECVMCLDSNNIISLPCHENHKICNLCVKKIKSCPFCRFDLTKVNDIMPNQLYIPLNFWFSNNQPMFIPANALAYQDININIKLDDCKWVNNVGNHLIKSVDLNIGEDKSENYYDISE